MVRLSQLAAPIALVSAVLAVPRSPPTGFMLDGSKHITKAPQAVYFITNNVDENAVVALKPGRDGKLVESSVTPTGGKGSNQLNGTTGLPFGPDALASQGSLTLVGDKLVVVNAGSNTISAFKIDTYNPTSLTLLGDPVDTMGDFPTTVGGSSKLKQACVGNTGARAGVACYEVSDEGLKPLNDALFALQFNQTTPPMGPVNGLSHVLFNEDSSALVAVAKGVPMTSNTGFLAYYPVVNGRVSDDVTMTSPPGTNVLFGSAVIPTTSKYNDSKYNDSRYDGGKYGGGKYSASGYEQSSPRTRLVVSDASFGAAVFEFGSDGVARTVATSNIPDQRASCWATLSKQTGSAFISDASTRLFEIDVETGALIQTIDAAPGTVANSATTGTNSTDMPTMMPPSPSMTNTTLDARSPLGFLDLATKGKFLYTLSPARTANGTASIAVFELGHDDNKMGHDDKSGHSYSSGKPRYSGKTKLIQVYQATGTGASINSQGMVVV